MKNRPRKPWRHRVHQANAQAFSTTDQKFFFKKILGTNKITCRTKWNYVIGCKLFRQNRKLMGWKTRNGGKLMGLRMIWWSVSENTGSWQSNCGSSVFFFQFPAKIQYLQKEHRFFGCGKPVQFCVCAKSCDGRSIDTLGMGGYVTPEIFRIQSLTAVSTAPGDKIRNLLTKSTCTCILNWLKRINLLLKY